MATQADTIRTLNARVGALERLIVTMLKDVPVLDRERLAAISRTNVFAEPAPVTEEASLPEAENAFIDWLASVRAFLP